MKQFRTVSVKSRAWVAIFAMLVQALLPAAVYASASKNANLIEVCTAFGIKKISVPDGADAAADSKSCPVCTLAQLLALPVPYAVPQLPALAACAVPAAGASQEYAAPRLSPYLRGPPAIA